MTDQLTQQLSPSLEDYLEAVFWAIAVHGVARARDIAKAMHVRASSVTGALQALARNRYINYAPYQAITLTAEGFDAALVVVQKHKALRDFFTAVLGVDKTRSEDIACKIEHSIPRDVANRIARFTSLLEAAPPAVRAWLDEFKGPGVANLPSRLATDVKLKAADVPVRHETTVVDLKPAELAVIVHVKPLAAVSRQLAHMGVGRGASITVERIAPLGDPISVKVRGGRLMLRKKDAANIVVVSK